MHLKHTKNKYKRLTLAKTDNKTNPG